jgi:hypothetical protein
MFSDKADLSSAFVRTCRHHVSVGIKQHMNCMIAGHWVLRLLRQGTLGKLRHQSNTFDIEVASTISKVFRPLQCSVCKFNIEIHAVSPSS